MNAIDSRMFKVHYWEKKAQYGDKD